jgi:hypothetical protein
VFVVFGHFFINYRRSPKSWSAYFQGKSNVLIWAKTWLGYILGNILKKLIRPPYPRESQQAAATNGLHDKNFAP